ncbi:MAG: glycosyltransferase family 2 protein [Candidatus Gastranaerophilales bacterium]|nr:glycosyltransferase family 2 protein [Candidatus Gastranaerophilales bacterium]
MENEIISIIIPIYNAEDYLETCLNSCFAQTYTNWEAICINDGSTDNSSKILNEFSQKDSRIKIIDLEKNVGISKAIEYGYKKSSGNIIAYLDSDDWFVDDYLAICYDAMKVTNADMINVGLKNYNEEGSFLGSLSNWNSDPFWNFDLNSYEKFLFYIGPTKIFKKDLFKNVIFKEGIRNLQDTCTSFQLSINAKKPIIISERIYNYRVRKTSVSRSKRNAKEQLNDINKIYDVMLEFLQNTQNIEKYEHILKEWKLKMLKRYLPSDLEGKESNAFELYLQEIKNIADNDFDNKLIKILHYKEHSRIKEESASYLSNYYADRYKSKRKKFLKKYFKYKFLNSLTFGKIKKYRQNRNKYESFLNSPESYMRYSFRGVGVRIENVCSVLKTCKGKKTVIYGAGTKAEKLLKSLNNPIRSSKKLNIAGVLDMNTKKQETGFNGCKVYPPEKIKDLNPDFLIVTVSEPYIVRPFIEKLVETNTLSCKILYI